MINVSGSLLDNLIVFDLGLLSGIVLGFILSRVDGVPPEDAAPPKE